MIRKAQIFLLLLVFLGSTTSFSFSLHLCSQMKNMQKEMSCSINMEKMGEMKCLKTDNNRNNFKSKIDMPSCCKIETQHSKIKDEFVVNKNGSSKNINVKNISNSNFLIDIITSKTNSNLKLRVNSLPNIFTTNIYLTISILLI